MLSFYLVCLTAINTNDLICELDESDVKRLIQFKVIKAFETDTYDTTDVECLPYFDDFRLTLSEIERMLNRYQRYAEIVRASAGFKSPALDRYEHMLKQL